MIWFLLSTWFYCESIGDGVIFTYHIWGEPERAPDDWYYNKISYVCMYVCVCGDIASTCSRKCIGLCNSSRYYNGWRPHVIILLVCIKSTVTRKGCQMGQK